MCDDPRHRTSSPDHDLLHQIVEDLGEMKGTVEKVESALWGEGTTKGLITKVDEIRTGQTDGAKSAGAWSGGIVATLIAVIAGVLNALGFSKT